MTRVPALQAKHGNVRFRGDLLRFFAPGNVEYVRHCQSTTRRACAGSLLCKF
jgi:hypothetical protein